MRNKRIEYIIDEILDQYAYADESTRPWIIGFSGGKGFYCITNACMDCA